MPLKLVYEYPTRMKVKISGKLWVFESDAPRRLMIADSIAYVLSLGCNDAPAKHVPSGRYVRPAPRTRPH
jgi:hypothetical protein